MSISVKTQFDEISERNLIFSKYYSVQGISLRCTHEVVKQTARQSFVHSTLQFVHKKQEIKRCLRFNNL